MTLLHYAARRDLRRAWTALQAGRLDDALKLYEAAIGTATRTLWSSGRLSWVPVTSPTAQAN